MFSFCRLGCAAAAHFNLRLDMTAAARMRRRLSDVQRRFDMCGSTKARTTVVRLPNLQSKSMFRSITNILSSDERGLCDGHSLLCLQVSAISSSHLGLSAHLFVFSLTPSVPIYPISSKAHSRHGDACLRAQEKLHPSCAKNPELIDIHGSNSALYTQTIPACHVNAKLCRANPMCR